VAHEAVSVYIDDAAIRVLRLSGRRPKEWARQPLGQGMVRDGNIVDEEGVASELRRLWAKHGFTPHRVIAGISGINCMYRFLTLPELPSDVLPEAVTREASRAFGVPLEQLYVSWQKIAGNPGETVVYAAASARSTIDALVRTLRKANLNPHVLDIAPLAISRATAKPNALIVDLETASLDIVVKIASMPEVVRTVPLTPSDDPSTSVGVIREELQRAVTFYNSGHPDYPVPEDTPILVAGLLGEAKDVWQDLLGRAQRPIDVIPCEAEAVEGFAPYEYVPNIGLALKETIGRAATTFSVINFDALPAKFKPQRTPLRDLLYIPALAVCIGGLVLGGYLLATTRAHTGALREEAMAKSELAVSLAEEKQSRQQDLEGHKDSLVAAVEADEEKASRLEEQLRSYETTNGGLNDDLAAVHSTPAGINVGTIVHSGSVIDVSGWGANESAVFQYARQLRSTGRFSQVVVSQMSVDGFQTAFSFVLYK